MLALGGLCCCFNFFLAEQVAKSSDGGREFGGSKEFLMFWDIDMLNERNCTVK